MCSCFRALKTSLAAECWTFCSLLKVDLDRLIAENYSSQVLTEHRHRFCGICSEVVANVTDSSNLFVILFAMMCFIL